MPARCRASRKRRPNSDFGDLDLTISPIFVDLWTHISTNVVELTDLPHDHSNSWSNKYAKNLG
jgi:hypothetical protein